MVKLDVEIDEIYLRAALIIVFTDDDESNIDRYLPNWVHGVKARLETGSWLVSGIANDKRDQVLDEYLSYLQPSATYETCPMCDSASVGPCLTHR